MLLRTLFARLLARAVFLRPFSGAGCVRLIALMAVAIVAPVQTALATGGSSHDDPPSNNNVTIDCDGDFSNWQTLCKSGGNECKIGTSPSINPSTSAATPQDNVSFSSSSYPVNVTWEVKNPDTTVDPPGSNNTAHNDNPVSYTIENLGTYSQNEGASTTKTQTVNSSNWVKISVTHNSSKGDFAVLQYRAKCTPPTPPKVKIKKSVTNGDGTTEFSFTASPALNIPKLKPGSGSASAETPLIALTAGTKYDITEAVAGLPQGWAFDGASCKLDSGSGSFTASTITNGVSLTASAGQLITCEFKNKRRTGNLTVKKKTEGGSGEFDFSISGPANPQTFTLQGGAEQAFQNLPVGPYTITETKLASGDWTLTSVDCGQAQTSRDGNAVTVNVGADANVICTFTNIKKATLTVTKQVEGGSAQSFEFTGTAPEAGLPFSLQSDQSKSFTKVGSYSITEAQLDGWELSNLTCSGGGSASKANRRIDVDLKAGDNIACTFTNKRQTGTLKVVKDAIGGNGTFNFAASGEGISNGSFTLMKNGVKEFAGLPTGTYTVSEVNIPAGWLLKAASCDDNSKLSGDTVTVTVKPNATVTCTFTNFKEKDDRAEDVTKVFIHRRVDNLLSHGPDRARVLRRLDESEEPVSLKDGGGEGALKLNGGSGDGHTDVTFSTSLSQIRGAAAAAANSKMQDAGLGFQDSYSGLTPQAMKQRFDLWVEGQFTNYDDGLGGINRDGQFKILYAGMDYAIAPGILVGALVQIDRTDEKIDNPDLKGMVGGTGWMAGPYVGIKLRNDLFFDARAAWGQSNNDIKLSDDVVGERTGSFGTDRWLATATLTANYQFGALRVSPQVGIAYGNEVSESYYTSLGQKVGSADVTIGRLTFGPEFGYRLKMDNGSVVEPHLAVKGIWNFDGATLDLSTGPVKTDEFRVQLEGGVMIKSPDGYSIRAAGSYDGIGDKDLEAWGAKAWLNIPLR